MNAQAITPTSARILVVDDDRINIMMFSDIFDDSYEILFATDGETALGIAASAQPDIILLDIMMPGIDGYEVCRRLKTNPATRDIPVIFITGLTSPEEEVKGLALGAVDYLTKPVVPATVIARVGSQLALKRTQQALAQCQARVPAASLGTPGTYSTARWQQAEKQNTAQQGGTMNREARARILVVDDELANIKLMINVFGEDHEILFATDGPKALEIARSVQPELILLDMMMADMDGYEVCRQLKLNPQTEHIPVIFVTAHISPLKEIEGLEIGAVDYISKPINPAVVKIRVRTHLNLARALRQVNDFNTTLEHQINERSGELKAAMESLHRLREDLAQSEARATMGTLIASISHELATPISNSTLASDMLTEHTGNLLDLIESGKLKRSQLEAFLGQLRQANNLLQRNLFRARDLLLNFKQVAVDQASEQRREFDLATTVREIVATLTPSLRNKPHQIALSIPPGILMNSLPGPLGQIVINLINNAYLHAFEGRTDGVLTIGATADANEVTLTVSDNGVGIPEENLVQLFDPFFSTKIGHGGTGLGMVIVDSMVRKTLGGSLTVQSTVNVGTRFAIRLPLTCAGTAV